MSRSVQAQTQVDASYESPAEAALLSRPEGVGYHVIANATTQSLLVKGDQERLEWSLEDDSNTLTLRWPQRSAPHSRRCSRRSKGRLPFTRPLWRYAFAYPASCMPTCVPPASP